MIITGSFPFPDFGTKSPVLEFLYFLSFALIVFFFLTYAHAPAFMHAHLVNETVHAGTFSLPS